MSWKRGTKLEIKAGWGSEGRLGTCMGPDLEVNKTSVSWTPVLWDEEEDPDWFKTRGLEIQRPKKHPECPNCACQ